MRGLIVTADDFGAAEEVNQAVEQAHTRGILTAASLMVGGRAVADAVDRARRMASLRVGLHLVLVEGRPVLPPEAVPSLVGPDGLFRSDMVRSALNIFLRPAARRHLAMEVRAQFEVFRATGLELDHVNTHKHFHLHPTIAATIIAVGRDFGVKAMRVPIEPRSVLASADPQTVVSRAYLTGPWSQAVRARLARAGLFTSDQMFGLQWSGEMTAARLRALVHFLPPGVSEIYLHPASSDDFEGAALGYAYAQELDALMAPEVIEAVRVSEVRLGGFRDFLPSGQTSGRESSLTLRRRAA